MLSEMRRLSLRNMALDRGLETDSRQRVCQRRLRFRKASRVLCCRRCCRRKIPNGTHFFVMLPCMSPRRFVTWALAHLSQSLSRKPEAAACLLHSKRSGPRCYTPRRAIFQTLTHSNRMAEFGAVLQEAHVHSKARTRNQRRTWKHARIRLRGASFLQHA